MQNPYKPSSQKQRVETITITTKDQQAAFWKRVAAYIFDFMLIDLIIIWPFKKHLGTQTITSLLTADSQKLYIISFSAAILTLAYWILFELNLGQTPGKMLFNLFVISKQKPTFNAILLRNITKPFILILILDVLYMFFKKENQRFTEKLSNTLVFEKKFILNREVKEKQ